MAKCSKCGTFNFHPRVSVNDNEILQRLRSSVGFTDQALTNQLLHDAEKDLDDYGTEIARLKTAISVLKRKREHLEGYVVKCRSLLSPIRRLPPEILSLIFLFRCRESGNDISLHHYDMTLPSIVLSQVCAGWRIVALDTSAIWSNLSFDFYQEPDLTCLNPSLLRSLIHLYLERSSQAPLDLSLFFIDHFDRDSDLGYAIFKTMLTPTSHRWRSLDLQYHCCMEEDIEAIWSQITNLSGLEHLKIYGEPLELLLRHASAFHQVTPRLCCLDLKFISGPLDLSGIPWAQITTLRLSSIFHSDLFEILRRCTHLTDLVVDPASNQVGLREPFIATNSVTLDYLRVLRYEVQCDKLLGSELIGKFFLKITAPALKQFTISWGDSKYGVNLETGWPLDVFAGFVTRSGCSISSFSIDHAPTTDSDCLSFLRLFPDLRELEIKEFQGQEKSYRGSAVSSPCGVITDGFLNGLHATCLTSNLFKDQSSIPCIPQLQHLSLHVNPDKTSFTPETLNDMVTSRWIPDSAYSSAVGIACLRSITLIGDKRAAEKTPAYDSLRELEKSGLRVEIF